MSKTLDGLAELSGTAVCAGPRCQIVLKTGQGKKTQVGDRRLWTCFQKPCVEWATAEAAKGAAS